MLEVAFVAPRLHSMWKHHSRAHSTNHWNVLFSSSRSGRKSRNSHDREACMATNFSAPQSYWHRSAQIKVGTTAQIPISPWDDYHRCKSCANRLLRPRNHECPKAPHVHKSRTSKSTPLFSFIKCGEKERFFGDNRNPVGNNWTFVRLRDFCSFEIHLCAPGLLFTSLQIHLNATLNFQGILVKTACGWHCPSCREGLLAPEERLTWSFLRRMASVEAAPLCFIAFQNCFCAEYLFIGHILNRQSAT